MRAADASGTHSDAGLLDTSVFIAAESNRPLGTLPLEAAVSVVAHELPVYTQDADFEALPGVRVVRAQTAIARVYTSASFTSTIPFSMRVS